MKKVAGFILLIFICYGQKVLAQEDWANLNKFKVANMELKAPGKNENRVVFMGNSITENWLWRQPSFFEDNPYINRGISGQTTSQMLLRFRQDVIALEPKVVHILAGTNDIAGNTGPMTLEEIAANIYSMAELAEANGIRVILCAVLPAADYPWKPGKQPNVKIPQLNRMIKAYAEANDHIYLDYFTPMATSTNALKDDLGEDGVHPIAKGYALMAPLAQQAIAKALR